MKGKKKSIKENLHVVVGERRPSLRVVGFSSWYDTL